MSEGGQPKQNTQDHLTSPMSDDIGYSVYVLLPQI